MDTLNSLFPATKWDGTPNNRPSQAGYTLLEVLVATAILVIGLAAILGISQSAMKRAAYASDLATVQLICQTVLNESLAKETPIEPFAPRWIPELPAWKIALWVYPSADPEIYILHLSAQKHLVREDIAIGRPYHLIRWISRQRVRIPQSETEPNPSLEFEDPYFE